MHLLLHSLINHIKYASTICFVTIASSGLLPLPLHAAIQPLDQAADQSGIRLQQQMIWATPDAKLSSAFVAFRKHTFLAHHPKQATLHLFADVRYMLWINGKYVLRGPARFDPKGPEYDVDDVAQFLRQGDNELVVLVMANQSNGKMMHHAPGLAVGLEVVADQGDQTTLFTDSSWKWSDNTRYRNPRVDWGKRDGCNRLDRGKWRLDTA